jgi:hypothetical protein
MRLLFFFLCFIVSVCTAFAQYCPLAGKWTGTITQTGKDNVANHYHFEVKLTVDSLQQIKGYSFSFIRQKEGKYALRASVLGKRNKNLLVLDETGVLEYENTIVKKADYCIKHIELEIDTVKNKMVGTWKGVLSKTQTVCEGGTITLEKWKPQTTQIDTTTVVEGEKLVSLQNRTIKKGKVITVKNKQLKVAIFDDAEIDDDIVSINFNGKWLAQYYKLKAQARYFTIHLDIHQPVNFLAAMAYNLGKMPPNTTAVEIHDGKKVHKVLLKSDLGETDVIYFEYEEE